MPSVRRVLPGASLLLAMSLLVIGVRPGFASGWEETVDFDSYDVTVKAADGTVLFIACLTTGPTEGAVVILDLPQRIDAAEVDGVYPISFVVDGRPIPFAMIFDGEKLLFNVSSPEEFLPWWLLIPEIAKAKRLTVASPDLGFAHEIPTDNAERVQKEMFKACDYELD